MQLKEAVESVQWAKHEGGADRATSATCRDK